MKRRIIKKSSKLTNRQKMKILRESLKIANTNIVETRKKCSMLQDDLEFTQSELQKEIDRGDFLEKELMAQKEENCKLKNRPLMKRVLNLD